MCGVVYWCIAQGIVITVDFRPSSVDANRVLDGIRVVNSLVFIVFKPLEDEFEPRKVMVNIAI